MSRSFFKKVSSLLLLLLTAAVAAVSLGAKAQENANGPATHTVIIKQMRFQTAQLNAKPGDVIEWENEDIFAHTATADNGSFDSGLINPGQSWKTVMKDTGTVGYHCRPHPNMTASIVIASAQEGLKQSNEQEVRSPRFEPPSSPEQFHPIFVNFTAALLPLSFLSDVLGRMFRRKSLHNAAWWLLLYATLITPLTVAAGWWWKHAAGPGLPAQVIAVHQWLGTSLALAFVVLAVWRWQLHKRDAAPGFAYLSVALMTVLALVYQGSLGGMMVFGK
jgi:plastocyanin/uncharacterized membrane protein